MKFKGLHSELELILRRSTALRTELAELDHMASELKKLIKPEHDTALPEQIKLVLEHADHPLPLREIYSQLLAHGRSFRAQNPKMSVYSALARHPEIFEKANDGWQIKA